MQRDQLKQRILRELSEFISYLKELISENRFDDGEVLEISLLVIKNGPEILSDKQWYVFLEDGILRDKYVDNCERCSEHIPWSNMNNAIFINKDYHCANCSYFENKATFHNYL
ncbi:hypothetical protein C7Y47_05195 [Lysinibacillus sphaericus]|uniref:Uncharacterized protein n=1 Tax=Lysinibacillus sphaericus TaxID=1421 RepID=A0A544UTC0_LYSSH|nr:hypothetical protein [Lysinibacillus sp. SDF0037]TQR37092.1 hypothetical protein C7Y47_05195 [Lysinibacillus sp. SDF0037]